MTQMKQVNNISFKKTLNDLKLVLSNTQNPEDIQRLKNAIQTLTKSSRRFTSSKEKPKVGAMQNKKDVQDYVTTKDVAEYYNVTQETVRDWIKKKVISGHQIGSRGRYMIPKEEFEYLKQKREHHVVDKVMEELLGDDYSKDWTLEMEE